VGTVIEEAIVLALLEQTELQGKRATLVALTAVKVASLAFLETSCGVGASNVEMWLEPGEAKVLLPRSFVEVVKMRIVEVALLRLMKG